MSKNNSQNVDQANNSDIVEDEDFENDDLITFQHESKTINFNFSKFTKYSKHIREKYFFQDVINHIPDDIHKFEEEYQLLPENVVFFFQLLQQNFNIAEHLDLTYIQCIDLLKLSKFLEVRKLAAKINQYLKAHNNEVDFIIQMLQYETSIQKDNSNSEIEISDEIEHILSSRIDECLSNEKFKELPIQILYRVIDKSSIKSINSNKLFDIIIKSIRKFCVLFQFLNLQRLSEDRLDELCEIYSKSNENTRQYFDYLKCNLNFIKEIIYHKKTLQESKEEQQNEIQKLETKIESLQKQLNDSNNFNNEQQIKTNDLETKISQLQIQFDNSKSLNKEQQDKMRDLESQISQLQNKLASSEKEVTDVRKQLKAFYEIKGEIVASVEHGLLINAEIKLSVQNGRLDTTKSKVIVSSSDAKTLGLEAYEDGEPITSLHTKTSFVRKSGVYYVRCIVFNDKGEYNEFMSNSVTISESSFTFGPENQASKISLCRGRYKLEVWGAKGGDSTGDGWDNGHGNNDGSGRGKNSTVKGGLGGYSCGILNLNKNETVYVYVGCEGRPSNSSSGSTTKGGFPDGGSTKTGHCDSSYTTVPGTGGGSTSIRIGSDTNYARVIVAGGGGGASGCSCYKERGGFGGGLNGGNCSYKESVQNQGAGTQTGSTRGLGERDDRHGYPGEFGQGATSNYSQGCDSGGGGGGGWYGGGSGGFGSSNYCSSGGGGSGWTFTESSHKNWKSGDPSNESKFLLDSTYYLSDARCVSGNEEFPSPTGNGNERGHDGNGYAKITPQ